jgi:hypothetical protein
MRRGIEIQQRKDWESLSTLQRHEAIPEWPVWVSVDGVSGDQLPKCCLTKYRDRTYACDRSASDDLGDSSYVVKLHPLTPCPAGWLWGDLTGIVAESTVTFSGILRRQGRMMQKLPDLLADADPAVLNRENWSWAGDAWLIGAHLRWKDYYQWSDTWDHDHCAICFATFSLIDEKAEKAGYAVVDRPNFDDDYEWVCKRCFDTMKDLFNWVVVE